MLTGAGVVMAGCAAVSIATGHLSLGLLFLVLTGLPDALDGAVAKAAGTAGPRGAFFDSVADRVSDTLLLGGVAWYLATTQPGLMPLLPMAVLGASLIISYERAKAESLGFNAKGGVMERAERTIALGLGLLFEALLVPDPVAHARPHRAHRRAALREGVAPGLPGASGGHHHPAGGASAGGPVGLDRLDGLAPEPPGPSSALGAGWASISSPPPTAARRPTPARSRGRWPTSPPRR